jgi:hypothetical protein
VHEASVGTPAEKRNTAGRHTAGHTAGYAQQRSAALLGLRITEAQACEILGVDLDECEETVNRLVKVPILQGQFDALTSL